MEVVNCSKMVPLSTLGPNEILATTGMHPVASSSNAISLKFEYFNTTKFDLAVIDRRNIKLVLTPTTGTIKGIFAVKAMWNISTIVRDRTLNNITVDDIDNSSELSKMVERWRIEAKNRYSSVTRIMDDFFYRFDEDVIRRKKRIYIQELDVVVCQAEDMKNVDHPYSMGGRLRDRIADHQSQVSKFDVKTKTFFTLNIFIVDNADKIGSRWFNFHGSVRRIESTKDPTSKDGFYIVEDREVNDGQEVSTKVSTYFESESDLKFPVYKSFQEAHHSRESDALYKLRTTIEENRIKELELSTRMARAESDNERLQEDIRLFKLRSDEARASHQRDVENAQRQVELERERAAVERERFEEEKTQMRHEKEMLQQKNFIDIIKTLGAVVTSILGLLLIASKYLK